MLGWVGIQNRRRVGALLLALAAAGCASDADLRSLRQPPLPPIDVTVATPLSPLYRNISIQEVYGAPEYRWFSNGDLLTTRPTRKQVTRSLTQQLDATGLLASTRLDSKYMLNVEFEELRGPNVWLFTDKLAAARVRFKLVEWRTGRVVRDDLINVAYKARFVGVTPDVVRAGLGGPILLTDDSDVFAPLGGALGGALVGVLVNDALVQESSLTNIESALLYGALGGASDLLHQMSVQKGTVDHNYMASERVGIFDGTARRYQALDGLMMLTFSHFLRNLESDGVVARKRAVSCASLNPQGTRVGFITETADAYAIDCPTSMMRVPSVR